MFTSAVIDVYFMSYTLFLFLLMLSGLKCYWFLFGLFEF